MLRNVNCIKQRNNFRDLEMAFVWRHSSVILSIKFSSEKSRATHDFQFISDTHSSLAPHLQSIPERGVLQTKTLYRSDKDLLLSIQFLAALFTNEMFFDDLFLLLLCHILRNADCISRCISRSTMSLVHCTRSVTNLYYLF